MAAEIIQARYDELAKIAARFGRQADAGRAMQRRVAGAAAALTDGGWLGAGASAFAADMNGTFLPALQRLTQAFEAAHAVTLQLIDIFKQAEAEASAVFNGPAQAALPPGATVRAPGSSTAGPATSIGASTGGPGTAGAGRPAATSTAPGGPRERGVLDRVDRAIRGMPGRPHTGVRFWTGAASALRGSAKAIVDRRYWRSFLPLEYPLRNTMLARNLLPPLSFRPWFGNPANPGHPAWMINHVIAQPPQGVLEKVVANPLVKGVGKVLTVANFGMSGYDLARDLNQGFSATRTPGKIGDFTASAVGLGAMVTAGTPASTVVLGPFAAGYGVGKLADWGTGKLTMGVGRLIGHVAGIDSLQSYSGHEISDIGSGIYAATHSAQPDVRVVDFLHDYVRGHGTADEQRTYSQWLHATKAYRPNQVPNTPVPQLKVFEPLGPLVQGANTGKTVPWHVTQMNK